MQLPELPVPEVGSPGTWFGSGTVCAILASSLAGMPRGTVSWLVPKPPAPAKKWSPRAAVAWRSRSIFWMVAIWVSRSLLTWARRRRKSWLFSRFIRSSFSLVRKSRNIIFNNGIQSKIKGGRKIKTTFQRTCPLSRGGARPPSPAKKSRYKIDSFQEKFFFYLDWNPGQLYIHTASDS